MNARTSTITMLGLALLTALVGPSAQAAENPAEEFVGPFPSWANVQTEFGAVGDGKADDTAAIQKALESVRLQASPKKVLYFPAGVYRITDTIKLMRISHHEPLGMSVTGQDPETAIIRWDGPAGASMFLYDAWFASLSRLTFDGVGKAKTAIEHGPKFATANECTDCIFKDVQFGIEAGQLNGIAETAVLRCRFYRCAKAGISIQGFNSLDWYIWHCWFEDCGIAATNEFRAGNFHLYYNTFLRSKDADITIRHTGYFSFLGNASIGSRRFFHAKRPANWKDTDTWGSQATLQDNRILDPTDPTPIVIENNGPNLLLDNVMRAKGAGPLVINTPPADKADLIVIGNTWSAAKHVMATGRLTELDNTVVAAAAIADVKPEPVPFAPHVQRPVIEVAAGAGAAGIQAAIDQAAALKGKRPVVHLPKGNYAVKQTLSIPADCDLQLVGDGPENATQLNGAGADPVIRVQGPTHARFRNFLVNGANSAVGILVQQCDQPGGRVFGEQLNTTGHEYGFVSDGLKQATVELRNAGHNGMQVVGAGPGTPKGDWLRASAESPAKNALRRGACPLFGTDAKPWVTLFAGASSRHRHHQAGIHLYDVRNDGRLLVRDIWYEGDSWSLMNLTGSGEFAYHCGFVAPTPGFEPARYANLPWEADVRKGVAALQFDGFKGKLAFTLVSVNGATLRVVPPSADLQLYLLGFLTNQKMDFGGAAVKGQVVAEHVKAFRKDGTGLQSVDGTGKATPEFVRTMLEPLRTVKPQPLTPRKDGVSDVRFYRVWATGKNGVRVQAGPAEKP